DVVAALREGVGLSDYLSVVPELITHLTTGLPPPAGVAVVRAVADWYCAGLNRPAPNDLVRQLYPTYLPDDDATLLDLYDDGVRWACTPVFGARLISQRTDGTGFTIHDAVLDHFANALPSGLPASTWTAIAAAIADSPDDLVQAGVIAYITHHASTAENLLRCAADLGDVIAMAGLGFLLRERGDAVSVGEAEAWWRRAADLGQAEAMTSLGVLLHERGDAVSVGEAEAWYRRAADLGDEDAMNNLEVLLEARGNPTGSA
ncbi:MAG TPA: tetratricopeptide repeat protein, partial [Kineosporiaceae bacterium]|nr:tetratricopeptide repeat protein [Kineosporiaceae bacterium]